MIQIIDARNAHLHSKMLRSFSALRYEVFIKQLAWPIPCREIGFEADQFDDQYATYLIAIDRSGEVAGGARLLDTSRRSLLGEVFPHLVDGPAPADPRIFEVTRLVGPRQRRVDGGSSVFRELLWGLQTYGMWARLTHFVSVSYVGLEPVLRRSGYQFRRLGQAVEMDGSRVVALKHDIDAVTLERSRLQLNVASDFFHSQFDHPRQNNATDLPPAYPIYDKIEVKHGHS